MAYIRWVVSDPAGSGQSNYMGKNIIFFRKISLSAMAFLGLYFGYGSELLAKEESESAVAPAQNSSRAPAPAPSLQIFLPPVLEKNKAAWGSVYDESGAIVANQRILLDDCELLTDEFGSFSFTVPAKDSVSFSVPSSGGGRNWELKYSCSPGGLLLSDVSASPAVDELDELSVHSSDEPVVGHAPAVVEPLQTFVIVGRNFSGRPGDDDVELDDRSADLLAASPRSLVAVSNQSMKIGPIKELRVLRRDLSSLPTEVDVSTPVLKFEPVANGKIRLRVNVSGSTLPVPVAIINESPRGNIRFGGWRLGRQNIFLSPGGQSNAFSVDLDAGVAPDLISARLISNGMFDPYTLKSSKVLLPKNVADCGEKAEIIRLKKREIGLEMQQSAVERERCRMLEAKVMTPVDEQNLASKSSSIASRLFRVQRMLAARRALLGRAADGEYNKLIDAAADGALSSLESVISSRDLGFTESRLLKVSGRRAEEKHNPVAAPLVVIPEYRSPPTAMLQSYKNKWGKRAYVPPPPQTMVLVPPPAPYRPDPNELGPMLTDLPAAQKTSKPTVSRGELLRPGKNIDSKKQKSARRLVSKKSSAGSPKKSADCRTAAGAVKKLEEEKCGRHNQDVRGPARTGCVSSHDKTASASEAGVESRSICSGYIIESFDSNRAFL